MKTLKMLLTAIMLCSYVVSTFAFGGLYVTKADATVFNQSAQVIMVRHNDQTTLTISSDFKGDVKDFAILLPVPELPSRDDIKLVDSDMFNKIDAYSAPRIAEYHDPDPCHMNRPDAFIPATFPGSMSQQILDNYVEEEKTNVSLSYTLKEYDIVLLSADESGDLTTWLAENDYTISEETDAVLADYIKEGMSFFVVKVNLKNYYEYNFKQLRPIQFSFRSEKFGLPIRLGMENADRNQDLMVYAFTKNGRLETKNYPTVNMPTDKSIPEFAQENFDDFYKAVFKKTWQQNDGQAAFLEYAWDLSATNYTKCDPCTSPPPSLEDLQKIGVDWLQSVDHNAGGIWGGANYEGEVYLTRLHFRYNRQNFPTDIQFKETDNKDLFQSRYTIHHVAESGLECENAQDYIQKIVNRRQEEVSIMEKLTGWKTATYQAYIESFRQLLE